MTAQTVTMGALWPAMLRPQDQGRRDLTAVSASGVRIRFADGQERLCGTSGLWNVNLGYGNAAIADAVGAALRDASYLSVFRYENEYAVDASESLLKKAGNRFGRVMYSTSGGAANDLTIKLARHYQALRGQSRRNLVVGLRGSYHGLTFGSFALTGEDLGQQMYGVDRRLVRHVEPNAVDEMDALMRRAGTNVAAIVVEPVLGTGAIPLSPAYIEALIELRREHGFLLVADEVATGFGRTGPFFASESWPEPPDLLVASKGLTNGTCAAAVVLVGQQVANAFDEAGAVVSHAETQAGTPPTCAAVLATISEMDRLDALSLGTVVSTYLDRALQSLVDDVPEATGHIGSGCFRAVHMVGHAGEPLLQQQVLELVASIRDAGAIVHPGLHGFQVVPALTYTRPDLEELFARVRRGVDGFRSMRHASSGATT